MEVVCFKRRGMLLLFVGIFQIFLKTILRITEISKMVTVNKVVFRITIKISYTSDFSDIVSLVII